MSLLYNPFGVRPVYSQQGTIRPSPVALIASQYNQNLFQGNPVQVGANIGAANAGLMQTVTPGVAGILPAGTAAFTPAMLWNGVFSGVEFTDLTGARRYLNRWIAGTTLPLNADLRAYYTADSPEQIYEVQVTAQLGVTEAAARAVIGRMFPFTAMTGNNVTGLGSVGLNVTTPAGATEVNQARIIGLNPGPDNDWTDPFPIVLVMNATHPWIAPQVAVA